MDKSLGWSWMGFLFNAYYYAGYGRMKKGIILIILSMLIPIFGIAVAVYCGIKAKSELPIGNAPFVWKNVLIVFFIAIISLTLSQILMNTLIKG